MGLPGISAMSQPIYRPSSCVSRLHGADLRLLGGAARGLGKGAALEGGFQSQGGIPESLTIGSFWY